MLLPNKTGSDGTSRLPGALPVAQLNGMAGSAGLPRLVHAGDRDWSCFVHQKYGHVLGVEKFGKTT